MYEEKIRTRRKTELIFVNARPVITSTMSAILISGHFNILELVNWYQWGNQDFSIRVHRQRGETRFVGPKLEA